MAKLRVGIIGTGKKKERPDAMGFAMAYAHADAYRALPDHCELVACADIVPANAAAFAQANNIPDKGIYTDYKTMLAEANLDVVSICTWPHLHAQMVIDSAIAGVRAIHCEKPMADSWRAARMMAQECERRGVQLTFNHQRRFATPFRKAYELLKSGAIGDLRRIEVSCDNIYDWGTHYIDMSGLYNDEHPAEWVIGQIDYRTENRIFGAHVENQAVGQWLYRNGVFGFIATGAGTAMIGVENRLIGTDGVIEVGVRGGPWLRVQRRGTAEWEVIDTEHGQFTSHIQLAIAEIINALETGCESELSARRALNATEIIFAIYESSRRRARVDLPLMTDDNALVSMVLAGDLHPKPADGQ
jgi:UDP-N-acetylglucosamine 3-dehydrogenase